MKRYERRDPRTALPHRSIWRDTSEMVFREHLVALETCTNAVPIDPQKSIIDSAVSGAEIAGDTSRLLFLADEQCLANDISSIVSVGQGAQSVAAVCLEERSSGDGLVVRVAAIDTINEDLRNVLHDIFCHLSTTCQSNAADVMSDEEHIFELIVDQHYARILGRLRSLKWQKPVYLSRSRKKPLWQDFNNLIHRVQFLFLKAEGRLRKQVEKQIHDLAALYQTFEETVYESDLERKALHRLIKSSYAFCVSESGRTFAHRLDDLPHATAQVSSATKTLQQIEKIAAYWRISQDLITLAKRYPSLFQNVTIEYVEPYSPVATNLAYESWAKTCHVHAETQLAVFYDLCNQDQKQDAFPSTVQSTRPPRCIGTSKYLCYLCHLFLTHRNMIYQTWDQRYTPWHISNTHGRLYDQWTIPDLLKFNSDTVFKYRSIIRSMDQEILDLTEHVTMELQVEQMSLGEGRGNGKSRTSQGKLVKWKVEPMTSRENLLLADISHQQSQ